MLLVLVSVPTGFAGRCGRMQDRSGMDLFNLR